MTKPKPNTHIIAFIGFQRVGKSTAAKYLEEKYGFVRHNMKDALVEEIKQNFPDLLIAIALQHYGYSSVEDLLRFEPNYINQLFETKPPLMRALLQNYGTEVRRGDDPDYWVKQWAKNSYAHEKLVVDDVRFINEGAKVKERGGTLIRLIREDITTGGTHASETEQLSIEADYTIECKEGDHEHLYAELDRILALK